MKNPKQIVQARPAETAGVFSMAVAMLLANKVLHWDDPEDVAYLAVVVSGVPAAVTWLVNLIRR